MVLVVKNEKEKNKKYKTMNSGGSIVIISNKNNSSICSINGKASKIRNGSTSPIKYMVFNIFSQFAKSKGETYWEDLFNNASRGVFPKGYKFLDGRHLSISIKGSIQRCDTYFTDYSQLNIFYETCKEFITKYSGVTSNEDNNIFFRLPSNQKEVKSWSGKIPPATQVVMVTVFVNDVASNFHFTEDKKEELLSNLIAKIYIGDLSGNEIKCNEFMITSIDGLYLFEGGFSIATKPIKQINKQKKKTTTTQEDEEIEKHVFKCSKNLGISLKRRYEALGY
jgi:hypothetical protein